MTPPPIGLAQQAQWTYPKTLSPKGIGLFCVIIAILLITGRNVEMGRMVQLTASAVRVTATGQGQSQVADGLAKIGSSLWPLQISETTEIGRIESFDRARLPWLSHIETRSKQTQSLNPETPANGLSLRDRRISRRALGLFGPCRGQAGRDPRDCAVGHGHRDPDQSAASLFLRLEYGPEPTGLYPRQKHRQLPARHPRVGKRALSCPSLRVWPHRRGFGLSPACSRLFGEILRRRY